MKVFLSYQRSDVIVAEDIALRISAGGDYVFFDRDSLPKGAEFDARIRMEIQNCDLFVFLISPKSVEAGVYARTELKFAKERWPQALDHILPVMVVHTPLENVPAYLRAINILEPEGNLVAEVAFEVRRRSLALASHQHGRHRRRVWWTFGILVVFTGLGIGTTFLCEYLKFHADGATVYGFTVFFLGLVLACVMWRRMR